MNVYFVSRYSKIKGPFDIIDSHRQHIIKVGDVCLRDTIDGVAFYVVYNSSNSWDSCKVVGFGENDTLSDIGNTLLFSFDGLSRRKGDIALIKQIRVCFREKVIDEFFCNAIEILDYKKDFWEGSLFPQFFAPTQEFVDRDKQKKLEVSIETNHYPSIFAQYLSKELLELLIASLNDGNELKEAYQIIRKKHPEMFRKALMLFLKENPSGTIFDKPADVYVPTVTVTEVEIPKATSQYNQLFEVSERIDDEPFETNERIDSYLWKIGCEILLSAEEEIEYAQKVRKGEIDARNKLVSANMRFVVGFAKQYLHKGLEFEDLLHEGFLGLIKAAERFDETRGFKFISYAAWWIRRYLTDAIVKYSSLIQFPLNLQILHRRIWNFKARYEHINGFFPPITEIEVGDEENLERISFLDSLPNNLKNICIPCADLDVFEDNHNDIWDYDESEYKKQYVRSMLDKLSKREREILIRAYGIGVREETLEAIGESRGLTRERVRQIKEKAIRKLREMTSVNSVEEKLSENQSAQKEDSTGQAVTIKSPAETQTLREVKMAFSQVRSDIFRRKPTENGKVILPSEESNEISRKEVDLNTRNYTVVNYNGKCNIYDHNKSLVYSSTGVVKEINESYYRVSLTHNFFSIGVIKRNHKGELFNAGEILLANQQTKLYHKLKRKGFIEMIEDIELNGRSRVKVDGCWFDERGNEVVIKTNSDSIIIEEYVEAKESNYEEIVQGEESETDKDTEEVSGTHENEVEHVFLNSKGQIEGTSNLPICIENRSGKSWSSEEEELIRDHYNNGQSFYAIAKSVGRTEVAIMSRLGMMGVIDYTYGQEYIPKEQETLSNSDASKEEQEFNGEELAIRYHYPVQDELFWDDNTKQVYEIYLADNYELIINHLIFDYNKLNEIEAHFDSFTEDEKEDLFSNYWYDNHINIIARIKPDTDGYEALKLDSGIGIQEIVYEPGKYTSIKYTEDDKDIFIDYNGFVFNTFEQISTTTNSEVAKYHNFFDAPQYITKEYIRLRMIEIKRIFKGAVKKVTIYTDSDLGQVLKNNSEVVWMLDLNAIITKKLKDENCSYPFKVYFRNGVKINDSDMETVKEKSLVFQNHLIERTSNLQASLKKKKDRIKYERQFKEIISSLFLFDDDNSGEEEKR